MENLPKFCADLLSVYGRKGALRALYPESDIVTILIIEELFVSFRMDTLTPTNCRYPFIL